MERYSSFYRATFALVALGTLGYLLLKMLQPLAGALMSATVLSFLLYPVHARLTHALKHRAQLSAGIITVLTPFVILAPLSILALVFIRQVSGLITGFRDGTLSIPGMTGDLAAFPVIGPVVRLAQETLPISAMQVQDWVTQTAHAALQTAASLSGDLVLGVAGTVVEFVLTLFILFFLLLDGRVIIRHVAHLIPMHGERRNTLINNLVAVMKAVVYGTAMTALIQGVLIGIGFAIIGLPSPVVFGALAAAAAFIPAVGTATVLVPAILYLMIVGRWGAAIFLLVWSGLLALGEQLIRPLLTSRHAEVSALAVFIGAIGGVSAFGFIGFVIGPVLISLLVELVRSASSDVPAPRP
ncbi:MAG TPA: AI-2E family transporter [Steroidobacteraceae bacterium]|nr:AI-2E family transporter [Steroidobacteraceae bacterium]